jgi:hypothetical protein
MRNAEISNLMLEASTLDFLAEERRKSLSMREWVFRMKGYGYGVREVGHRMVITKLPQGQTLGALPAEFG